MPAKSLPSTSGNRGSINPCRQPAEVKTSISFNEAAATFTNSSPASGRGVSTSAMAGVSGTEFSVTARMSCTFRKVERPARFRDDSLTAKVGTLFQLGGVRS